MALIVPSFFRQKPLSMANRNFYNKSNPGYLLLFTAPIFSEASIKKWCSNGTSSVPKCTFFVSTKKMKVYWKKYIKCLTRHRIIRKISHF